MIRIYSLECESLGYKDQYVITEGFGYGEAVIDKKGKWIGVSSNISTFRELLKWLHWYAKIFKSRKEAVTWLQINLPKDFIEYTLDMIVRPNE